ncbi:MAG: metal-dependent transcriptional regulator [Ardenticatenaceae bacterium]|nr:metal-dependent transcriptional regulator [Ardenticatenaceae bacterium]MCB9444880.1 metal-dependent transcriptional regulator [Ardenticatenaceae bacterium]
MYLKTIRELTDGNEPVPISALARRLEVSTVSATEMIHRLEDHNLVTHTPYKGVQLTDDGCHHASEIIRSHRLWERFLVDHLHIPWEKVHDVACRLEHATDPEVTNALADFLGNPETCPHGNPIPEAGRRLTMTLSHTLSDLVPGDSGVIERIHPESNLLLEYLAMHNVIPGHRLVVTEIAPFNGPIMVDIDGQTHALGQEVAAHIFVKPINEA